MITDTGFAEMAKPAVALCLVGVHLAEMIGVILIDNSEGSRGGSAWWLMHNYERLEIQALAALQCAFCNTSAKL